jgi:hypothetical protein
MRAVPFVAAAFAVAVASGASAAPFKGNPPMMGAIDVGTSAVAFDAAGNRYVAGNYFAGADFDPGPGVQTRPVRAAGSDPYVTKFDPTGKWLWTQTFGGTANDQIDAIALNNTTLFAVGAFESNDAGFGTVGTISAGSDANDFGAGFIIALDLATGEPVTAFNGTGAQVFAPNGGGSARATCVSTFGSTIYVGGHFGAVGFGIGLNGTINSTGQNDGFVAVLDGASGGPLIGFSGDGIQTFGGNGHEYVRGVVQRNSRVYVAGEMSSVNFGVGGVGTVSSGAQFISDAFLVGLQASNGNALASFATDGIVTVAGAGNEGGYAVVVDATTAYLAGIANSASVTIDGTGSAFPLIGGRDVFVLAVDAFTGAPATAFANGLQFFGATTDDGSVTGLALTPTAVYVAGQLGSANAGIGAAGSFEQADSYLLALDRATGNALAGFAGDGVQTLSGANDANNFYQSATINALASGPAGLGIVGGCLATGRVGVAGANVKFPAPGAYLVLFDPATGDPGNMSGVNHRPLFLGPPIATPNPAVAGKPVRWKVLASDPDKNPLKFFWDFGDETTSTSKAPKKVFASAGTFTTEVTVDDGKGGQSASLGTDLVVFAAGVPYFDVTKLTLSLKFPQAAKDAVVVAGQFPLADGTALAGKSLTIDVGGESQTFVLGANGKAAVMSGSAAVKPPVGGVAKFTAKLTGNRAAGLADEGLDADKATNQYAPTTVTVTFDGVANAETYPLFWTNKSGKSGTAK